MHKLPISRPKLLRIIITIIGIVLMLLAMIFANRIPLHQRVLIQGIGIDKSENGGYDVTVQAISTSVSASVEVYETQGDSLYEALNNITLVTGKSPFYTHNSIIIIGRECAEAGLYNVIDFFIRHHQTRPAENMFMAADKAGDILTLKSSPEITMENEQLQTNQYVLASQIEQLASAGDLDSQLLDVRVLDVANNLYSEHCDVVLPILSVQEESITEEGCAVFFGDKLRGILDRQTTVGMKAINNKLTGGAVNITLDNGDVATLDFLESRCQIKTEIRNNIPHFTLTLSCKMGIKEINRPLHNKLSMDAFDVIGNTAAERIQSVVEQAVEATIREYRSDVICFSNTLWKQQTSWWKENEKDWRTIMKQCTFSVSVDASVSEEGQEMSPVTFEPVSLF